MTTHNTNRRWFILILILIPVFIGALDLTIVSAILPEVMTRLNIPLDTHTGTAAWAITGYLLAYTLSMTLTGRISDLVGRRKVYFVCLVIFIVGSWWVATAHELPTALLNLFARVVLHERPDTNLLTLYSVIIGRIIQALGAGAMVPVSMALVGDLFPPEHRAQPIGLIGAIDTVGWVLGHLYGGLMVNFFNNNGEFIFQRLHEIGLDWPAPDWHTLFYINVPIGIIALILTWLALRGVEHPASGGRFDYVGAVLASLALIGINVGVGGNADAAMSTSRAALESGGGPSPVNLPLLIVAAVCFVAFLVWEWRNPHPLIELHLFRKRNVAAASATNVFIGFCLMLALVSVALLINLRAEDASAASIAKAAEQTGILLSGLTIPMALVAIPGGWLANRLGYRATTTIGLALAAVGFAVAGVIWTDQTPDWQIAANMVVVGIGLGLTISPIGTAVINEADESQHGVASALVIILRLVGMTLAVSSLTAYAFSRITYLVDIARSQFPTTLTAQEMEHASVQAYFSSGVHVIAEMLLVGAVVCVLALIPALFLRGKGEQEAEEADSRVLEQKPQSAR
jgi:MFS family permease